MNVAPCSIPQYLSGQNVSICAIIANAHFTVCHIHDKLKACQAPALALILFVATRQKRQETQETQDTRQPSRSSTNLLVARSMACNASCLCHHPMSPCVAANVRVYKYCKYDAAYHTCMNYYIDMYRVTCTHHHTFPYTYAHEGYKTTEPQK